MRFLPRTTAVETSPIALAHEALTHRRPGGRDLLDLSQAAPSYPPAPVVATRIAAVATEADGARYAPSRGLPALREAFADELTRDYATPIGPEFVQITAGANQAFCVVTSALSGPGDNILLPVPYYFNHRMWLELDGVEPRFLPATDDLLPTPDQVVAAVDDRTRALVVVSPGNPTGAIASPERLRALADACRQVGIPMILDETYRTFVPGDGPVHDLHRDDDWPDHVIGIHSFSKDLAVPGYRVGAVVGSPALLDEMLKLLDCVAICAPRVGQEAVLTGLRAAGGWRRAQVARIAETQGAFEAAMADRPGGFELASAGAFFGWVRHPYDGTPSVDVVRRLVAEADTLVIPGTAFTPDDDGWLRFSFANLDAGRMPELADRLESLRA